MKKIEVNIGEVFGRWVVISEAIKRNGKRNFLCECSCSNKTRKIIDFSSLRMGTSLSCGCWSREEIVERNTKHGLSTRKDMHPLYGVWKNMKGRCYSEGRKDFDSYMGRGIYVCDEWLHSFKPFYDWAIVNGYEEGLEIDRRDNDGSYEPSNCRFTTRQINNINQRVRKDNIIGYRGVGQDKRSVKWFFIINYNKISYKKYGFKTANDAAIARDVYIIKNKLPHHLNFPELAINGPL